MNNSTLNEMIGQRVECKIHGGFWWLELVAYDGGKTATVLITDGTTRELPVVDRDYRFAENCVIAPRVSR
jgi:hypothetical protein